MTLRVDLDRYLMKNPLTPRAVSKLHAFYRSTMNTAIVVGNITSQHEFDVLMAYYDVVRVELPLGLTLYDMNDTFTQVVSIINLHFRNQLYRAKGGFHMRRIATSTNESVLSDAQTPQNQTQQQSMWGKLNALRQG